MSPIGCSAARVSTDVGQDCRGCPAVMGVRFGGGTTGRGSDRPAVCDEVWATVASLLQRGSPPWIPSWIAARRRCAGDVVEKHAPDQAGISGSPGACLRFRTVDRGWREFAGLQADQMTCPRELQVRNARLRKMGQRFTQSHCDRSLGLISPITALNGPHCQPRRRRKYDPWR